MTDDEQSISESDGQRDLVILLTLQNHDNIDNRVVDCQVSCGQNDLRSKIMEVEVEMDVERGERRLVVMDDGGVERSGA